MSSFEKFPAPTEQLKKNISRTEVEEKEDREKILESVFETAIEASWKINEGNNGIVCLFEMDKAEEEVRKALFELNAKLENKEHLANKILKIYRPGEGEKEFGLQKEFWQAVENHSEKEKMMKIPEPLVFKDIAVRTKDVQQKLNKWGFKIPTFSLPEELKSKIEREKRETLDGPMREIDFTEEELKIIHNFAAQSNFKVPEVRAEIFLMDMVEGEDLATLIYREVIKKHPGAADWGNETEGMSFDQMQDKIAQIFDFKKPGGRHARGEDKLLEEEMVKKQNAAALRKYLIEETNFKIIPEQFEKIERTINFLNSQGLFHRDLH